MGAILGAPATLRAAAHPGSPIPHSDGDPEGAVLPKDKLVSLCKCEPILKWMRNCDHILYQALVEILIPDVLRPVPSKRLHWLLRSPFARVLALPPQNEAQGSASSRSGEACHS